MFVESHKHFLLQNAWWKRDCMFQVWFYHNFYLFLVKEKVYLCWHLKVSPSIIIVLCFKIVMIIIEYALAHLMFSILWTRINRVKDGLITHFRWLFPSIFCLRTARYASQHWTVGLLKWYFISNNTVNIEFY